VAYHCRNLGRPPDERCNRRYDWALIQRFYDAGHSVRQCQERFGFSRQTWDAARRRGDVSTRSAGRPLETLLIEGRTSRQNLKRRLVAAGLKAHRCERCGIDDWRGEPLAMALHHVNGDGRDNRLENLMILCPNCHSQTENFGGRNKGRPRAGGVGTAPERRAA
jgi:5-methylcytosine-specific restriction endonuclease McrA